MQWEDPPEPDRVRTPPTAWTTEAETLRTRPGRWARLTTYPAGKANAASSLVRRINAGELRAFAPEGLYEACSRTGNDGCAVFARYLGE